MVVEEFIACMQRLGKTGTYLSLSLFLSLSLSLSNQCGYDRILLIRTILIYYTRRTQCIMLLASATSFPVSISSFFFDITLQNICNDYCTLLLQSFFFYFHFYFYFCIYFILLFYCFLLFSILFYYFSFFNLYIFCLFCYCSFSMNHTDISVASARHLMSEHDIDHSNTINADEFSMIMVRSLLLFCFISLSSLPILSLSLSPIFFNSILSLSTSFQN